MPLSGYRNGKRTIRIKNGIYPAFSRLCNWNRKCMEVSLCCRFTWRRFFCTLLSVFPGCNGSPCYDDGICSRTCQQEKYYTELPGTGKAWPKMAFERIPWDGWQLPSYDVLYNSSRLDALLLLPDAYREIPGKSTEEVGGMFQNMLASPQILAIAMVIIVAAGIFICSMGLQKGVERITKIMMSLLLVIIIVLAIHSFTLKGGMEGLKFYLLPDFQRMKEAGIWETITAAMNQAFFTLSLGIGAMGIFGSYIDKKHSLLGESLNIAILDTFVAFVAGLIIFPSCFAFDISPDQGPGLIFITLPNIFNEMAGGRIWGTLFFIFMSFAAFSTILAVFENIICCGMDLFHWSRKKSCIINLVAITALSLPCVFGYNLWSAIQPLGDGSTILDLEDFLVSNMILPIGSLCYLLFCVSRFGWGFEKYMKETNTGEGAKMPQWIRVYVTYILPVLLLFLIIKGLIR